ncbi:MAG: hypothetical protein ACRD9R_01595 [Pyrinomonadaceae bacterium]
MKVKPSIKIIRREVRERREKSADAALATKEATNDSARDASNTVATWVREFRQSQQAQSKSAIKNLFRDAAMLSGEA